MYIKNTNVKKKKKIIYILVHCQRSLNINSILMYPNDSEKNIGQIATSVIWLTSNFFFFFYIYIFL